MLVTLYCTNGNPNTHNLVWAGVITLTGGTPYTVLTHILVFNMEILVSILWYKYEAAHADINLTLYIRYIFPLCTRFDHLWKFTSV